MLESLLREQFEKIFTKPVAKIRWITKPNVITLFACLLGLMVIPLLYFHQPILALVAMLLSGYCDVLDGTIARVQNITTELGSFFDIMSDRIVEAAIIIGLCLWDPSARGVLCLLMLSSVLLCITAFLFIGIFAENESNKSFHYNPGLMERAEAFIFFGLMMLLPDYFRVLALVFTVLVLLTVVLHFRSFRAFNRKCRAP